MTFQGDIGLLAGMIGFLGFVPYIIGTLNGSTRPDKATWIIWAAMGFIIAASYFSAGARESAWLPIAYAFGILAVAALSLKYGKKGWTRLDLVCMVGAGIGLLAWWLTNEPLFALYLTILVDALGFIPTLEKAYHEPGSEDRLAWTIFLIADLLNIFAISEWTIPMISYPVYVFAFTLVLSIIIWLPRKR